MRPALRAHAVRQRGLVTRTQCWAAGYRDVELRGNLAPGGPWVRVRHGVYAEADRWAQADEPEQRSLHDLAAHLVMVTEHVMSHDSAARAHGVPLLRPRRELVHITREGVRGGRTEAGVKHHLTQFPLPGVLEVGGMPVTNLARTGLDVAREHGRDHGVVALDHLLRSGVKRSALRSELEVMRCWPGVTRSRVAVELADAGAETPIESLARMLLVDLGFTDIDTQFPVLVDGVVFWADLRVGCHLVEPDGMLKYLPTSDGGISDRPLSARLRDERQRQAAVCGEGLGMSRVVWDDHVGRGRARALERIAREIAVTEQRFGSTLPTHLAERAARIRATTPRRTTRHVPSA